MTNFALPARAHGRALERGFTLVEMLVTVALVGILALAMMPLTELTVKRQREQELRLALRQTRAAIDAYKVAWDEGRILRKVDSNGYPTSLQELEEGVEDPRVPGKAPQKFIRRIPRDPMHPDPSIAPADTWGKRNYASSPSSPSEGKDVFDIYSLSDGVGLNGIPYRQW